MPREPSDKFEIPRGRLDSEAAWDRVIFLQVGRIR